MNWFRELKWRALLCRSHGGFQVFDEAHSFLFKVTSEADTDALFLTLTAEEVGRITVMIIKGVERDIAIRAMPHYSDKKREEYEALYDQLREAIEWILDGE